MQVGVRCSLRLEAPVADAGQMIVTEDYVRWVAACLMDMLAVHTQHVSVQHVTCRLVCSGIHPTVLLYICAVLYCYILILHIYIVLLYCCTVVLYSSNLDGYTLRQNWSATLFVVFY